MEAKMPVALALLFAAVLISGCISEEPLIPPDTGPQCASPKVLIGNVCCLDGNRNSVCDMDEAGCPASCDDSRACTNDTCSVATSFKCNHTVIPECCGNGICEASEDRANVCPEDCLVLNVTQFEYVGIPDYVDGDKYVFIHTASVENEYRVFNLTITAGSVPMENLRYTFKCNSTQHKNLDSIDSEPYNLTEDEDMDIKINKLEDANYLIFSNFFTMKSPTYSVDIRRLNVSESAKFHISISKKEPQKRDELSCLVKLYFMSPHKLIDRWLKISFI